MLNTICPLPFNQTIFCLHADQRACVSILVIVWVGLDVGKSIMLEKNEGMKSRPPGAGDRLSQFGFDGGLFYRQAHGCVSTGLKRICGGCMRGGIERLCRGWPEMALLVVSVSS